MHEGYRQPSWQRCSKDPSQMEDVEPTKVRKTCSRSDAWAGLFCLYPGLRYLNEGTLARLTAMRNASRILLGFVSTRQDSNAASTV
jgi:hypothetical protein